VKKLAILVSIITLLVLAKPAHAKVERVTEPWDLIGDWIIDFDFGSHWIHDLFINNQDDDGFSGTGGYQSGILPYSHPWTVTGEMTGEDDLMMTILYDNQNYEIYMDGSVSSDGTLSGDCTTSIDQSCTWESISGEATLFEGNHGQYVKSQENKKEAAKSRIGMPVKSKGHLKGK